MLSETVENTEDKNTQIKSAEEQRKINKKAEKAMRARLNYARRKADPEFLQIRANKEREAYRKRTKDSKYLETIASKQREAYRIRAEDPEFLQTRASKELEAYHIRAEDPEFYKQERAVSEKHIVSAPKILSI